MTPRPPGRGWRPRSLRAQLLTYGAASVLLAVAATAALNLRFSEGEAHRRMEARALDVAAALAAALAGADPSQAQRILVEFREAVGPDPEYHAQVLREVEALRWRKGSKGRVTKGEEGGNHMHARQGIGFWIADGGLWI